jgi:carbonic anhydrase
LIVGADEFDGLLALYPRRVGEHCMSSHNGFHRRHGVASTRGVRMTDPVQKLIQGNAGFSTHRFTSGLKIIPALKVFVIGCVDPRVDPAQILGLDLGEVAMIRNIGGRITASVLDELVLLRTLTQAAGGDFDQGWTFLVLQHTDCGILRMQGERARLATFFGVDEEALDAKSIGDPHAAVAVDVAALRGADGLPDGMQCVGMVYDVNTGLVEIA